MRHSGKFTALILCATLCACGTSPADTSETSGVSASLTTPAPETTQVTTTTTAPETETEASSAAVTQKVTAEDGAVYSEDGTVLFEAPKNVTEYRIPNGVKTIAEGAFAECEKLESVKIPYGVTDIGEHAFSGCVSLKAVHFPKTLDAIYPFAFSGCLSLEEISFLKDAKLFLDVFYECPIQKIIVASECDELRIENDILRFFDHDDGREQWVRMLPNSDVESLLAESSVSFLGSVFKDCKNLKEFAVKDGCDVTADTGTDFIGCTSLERAYIPRSVLSRCLGIEELENVTIYTQEGSNADKSAQENGLKVVYVDNYEDYLFAITGFDEETGLWQGELPKMDGSTSAAPLEAGLKAAALGISEEEAEKLVKHTTTYTSFNELIYGRADMIFSVPISENQRKDADEKGVKLTMIPVAKEAFVFTVNAENPVDSLTSEQIRKIYSGEITNWSEVGGNDAKILAYQRNRDSGSQNYMTEFMGDTPLMKPETERYIPTSMGELMAAIAVYDNAADAIGYSVYSYAAQMYENAGKVKFIAVDGVKPTKETMADGSYPLLSVNYIIYTDKSDWRVEKFTEFVLSDKGQQAVYKAGYIPVKAIDISDIEAPEKEVKAPYTAVGTGIKKPKNYTPDRTISKAYYSLYYSEEPRIDFLKDKEFQAEINAEIQKAWDKIEKDKDKYAYSDIGISCVIKNGYLSVIVANWHSIESLFAPPTELFYYNDFITLNYDLFEKKKIEKLSDLFYEGEDFVPWLNDTLSAFLTALSGAQMSDFMGLMGEQTLFTIVGVGITADNGYLEDAMLLSFDFDEHFYDISPVGRYRDITPLVDDTVRVYEDTFDEYYYDYYDYDGILLPCAKSRFLPDEEVAAYNEKLSKIMQSAIKGYMEICGMSMDDIRYWRVIMWWSEETNYWRVILPYGGMTSIWIDSETLEPLTMDEILGENWRKYVTIDDPDEKIYIGHFSANKNSGGYVNKNLIDVHILRSISRYGNWDHSETFTIPKSELNTKYLDPELQ